MSSTPPPSTPFFGAADAPAFNTRSALTRRQRDASQPPTTTPSTDSSMVPPPPRLNFDDDDPRRDVDSFPVDLSTVPNPPPAVDPPSVEHSTSSNAPLTLQPHQRSHISLMTSRHLHQATPSTQSP